MFTLPNRTYCQIIIAERFKEGNNINKRGLFILCLNYTVCHKVGSFSKLNQAWTSSIPWAKQFLYNNKIFSSNIREQNKSYRIYLRWLALISVSNWYNEDKRRKIIVYICCFSIWLSIRCLTLCTSKISIKYLFHYPHKKVSIS